MRILPLLAVALVLPAAAFAAPGLEDHAPRLLVETPSEAVVGEPMPWTVLLQERWGPEGPDVPTGGVARATRVEVTCTDPDAALEDRLRIPPGGRGAGTVVFATPGWHRLHVEAEAGLAGDGPPVRVLAAAPAERVRWGDLHAHLHGPGAGHAGALPPGEHARLLAEGLAWGRDVSLLDFAAFTPHLQTAGGLARRYPGSDRTPWDDLLATVDTFHAPGRFVVFPGFEWQGDAGDHCVVLPGPGALEAPADLPALARSVRARGGLLTAHAIYLPTEFDPRVPLDAIEVTRDSKSTEALGLAALRRGIVVPFLGCGDGHGGAIGATSITGVRTADLSREAVLEAIRAGRSWATNGERIVLDVSVDDGGPLPVVRARGVGTGPIDRVEVWRNGIPVTVLRPETDEFPPVFDVAWEDADLLRLELLDRAVAYHVRVVQTTANRYDPSRRDLALSSPVPWTPAARHLDAAWRRAGGEGATGPGGLLVAVRDAWDAFRPAPDRALRDDVPAEGAAAFPPGAADALHAAVDAVTARARSDAALGPIARRVDALPGIAAAVAEVRAVRDAVAAAAATGPPSAATVAALRRRALAAHQRAAAILAPLSSADREALTGAWFAARELEAAGDAPLRAIAALEDGPDAALPPLRAASAAPVTRIDVPVDPRVLAAADPVGPRTKALRAELDDRWGFTAPRPAPGDSAAALRVRVVAEGERAGARLAGGPAGARWEIPLEAHATGWVADVPRDRVPLPGDPPLVLEFATPVVPAAVHVEGPGGAFLPAPPRLRALAVERSPAAARATLDVAGDALEVALVRADGAFVWDGLAPGGPSARAFAAGTAGPAGGLSARWGFAGWRRAGAVPLPGHEAARPLGFGALPDGRALVAVAPGLVLVDPVGGAVVTVPWPPGRAHEPGRALCVVPRPATGRVLVRGASGPSGGWVAALDPRDGTWHPVAPGPEAGTVAAHPDGGIAWLVGRELHRRDAADEPLPSARLDATGRLLGFDPLGRAVVRPERGGAVRVDVASGAVVDRIEGTALAVDATGAVVTLEGLDARHPEVATGVRLGRVLADGARRGPWTLALRPSPVLDPCLRAAPTPDGGLLLLGGTTWWRRLPDHDWWGATVERWDPVWAGETPES